MTKKKEQNKKETNKPQKKLEKKEEKEGEKILVLPPTTNQTKEAPNPPKKQIKKENEILKNLFFIIAIIALFFIGMYFGSNSLKSFDYQGLKWDIVKAKEITFYHTSFPVYNGTGRVKVHVANHNVYLRNDPRKLEENIEFNGNLKLTEMLVIEGLSEFNCDGYGAVSQDSFEQVLNAWGTQVIQDPEASCDVLERYNFIKLEEGDRNWIESKSATCHIFYIKDCEVFKTKERFLVEEFINRNS